MNCAYLRYKSIRCNICKEIERDIHNENNKALDNNRYTTKPSLSLRDDAS